MSKDGRDRVVWIAVACLAVGLGLGWAVGVDAPWLRGIDTAVIEYFDGVALLLGSPWEALWRVISFIASPVGFAVTAAFGAAWFSLRPESSHYLHGRDRRVSLFLILGVTLGSLLPTILKAMVARPRPLSAAFAAFGSSFPSGHAFTSAAAATAVVLVVARIGCRHRALVGWCAVSVAAVVDLARVALRVHYLSDVVAGSAFGIAWVCLVALIVFPVATQREREKSAFPSR